MTLLSSQFTVKACSLNHRVSEDTPQMPFPQDVSLPLTLSFLLPEPSLWIHSWGSPDHFIPSIFVKNIFTILSWRVWACGFLQRSEEFAPLELELLTSVCELSEWVAGTEFRTCTHWDLFSHASSSSAVCFYFKLIVYTSWPSWHWLLAASCSFIFTPALLDWNPQPCTCRAGLSPWATSSRPWWFAASSLKLRFVSNSDSGVLRHPALCSLSCEM